MKKYLRWFLPSLTVLGVILAVYIASVFINSEIIAPSPKLIFKEFFALLFTGKVWTAILSTLYRAVIGFVFSFLVAAVFAILAYVSDVCKKLFYPIVVMMRATPNMSVILLCLIWLKSSLSPIAVAFIVLFPLSYSAILGAFENVDKSLFQMSKVYGVKSGPLLFKMVLPSVEQKLFPEIVSLFSFSIKLTVAGESLAYTSLSIGKEMYLANVNLETAKLLAHTVIAILMAFSLEVGLKLIRKIIIRSVYGYNDKKIKQALR